MIKRSDFFKALANGALWDVGVAINRTNPLPLDKFSVFKAYSDNKDTDTTTALGYAKNSVIAYPGQIIAVVAGTDEAPVTTVYVIKKTGTGAELEALETSNVGSALNDKLITLEGQVVKTVTGDKAVKATKTGNAVTLATQTSAVEGNILEIKNDGLYVPAPEAVTVPEYSIVKDESSSDYAAVYHLTKNKVNTGVAINIPKDKVVKSGTVERYTTGNLPTGVAEAGTYLVLVLENVADPLYIKTTDLVDVFTGDKDSKGSGENIYSTIQVNVNDKNEITASILNGGVHTAELADRAVTSAKIALNGVTTDNIASNAINARNIASGAVSTGKIADNAVTADKINDGEIGANKLADGAVTKAKLHQEVKDSLSKADSAIQSVTLEGGTNNGTLKLTVNETATDNIAVTGLGTAAYKEASAFDTAGAAAAVLGDSITDTAESNTVHGVKKKAEANTTAITGLQNGKVTKVDNTSIVHGTLYGETVGSQGKSSTKTYNIMRENSTIEADAWSTMTTMEDGPVGKNYVPVYVAADGEQLQLLTGTPSRDLAAANKKYVDDTVNTAVSSGITVQTTGTGKYVTNVTKTNGEISVTKGTPAVDLSELTDTTNILDSKANVTDLDQAKTDLTGAINRVKTDLTTEIGKKQNALDFEGEPSKTNKVVTKSAMDSAISTATAGLTGAMHFVGNSTSDPLGESGPTIAGHTGAFKSGDVCTHDKKEFVYDGTSWRELGSEGSYILKNSEAITNADIADAAIAQSKIDGLTTTLAGKIEGMSLDGINPLLTQEFEVANGKIKMPYANGNKFGVVKVVDNPSDVNNAIEMGLLGNLLVNNVTTDILKNGTKTLILNGGGAAL